ncbi:hypothetical protein [Arthrobacter mangrovi]|uniref:ABC transporter permease n=1 Tax=Arthrobacter mangrovi TaxID=2966350 RepID=A0ABQ5MT20_9MICC|nr:hypothetical protein [Arthrobacter mangrovi]GLB66782.1 hypothetical protein AHIS1636_12210 [Arthrobacter mangrovi]
MNRVVNVARMQLINKWTYLGIPAIILASAFLITYAIWALVPSGGGAMYSGAAQSVMWYFLALGIMSMTQTFPFSQAMSVSRRTFYIGTLGLFAVVALAISVLYYVLGLIEKATGGWGVNGQLYALGWLADQPALVQIYFYFIAMVALFMIGFWFATIYKRWQATGMLVVWIAVAVVLLGLVALATWQGLWPEVGAWFVAQTPLSVSGWATVFCAALACGSYLTLRRATP